MKLLKKINNNFALALDSKNAKIIVEGRGIGFLKMPCELIDLSKISHTYYSATKQDLTLLETIPESILEIASDIADKAMRQIGNLNSNLTFILADHIEFMIERKEKGIEFQYPIRYDVQKLYPIETKLAKCAIDSVEKQFCITLNPSESTGIAMNIINAEIKQSSETCKADHIIQVCTKLIENEMNIEIDRESFSYSRFASHLEYIIQKHDGKSRTFSDNEKLYAEVSDEYPDVSKCVDLLATKLTEFGYDLDHEEKLYLILHVNRLCGREECNKA